MYKIKVIKKSGFFASLPLLVLDSNKKFFYCRHKSNHNSTAFFNLPAGVYFCEQNLKKSASPVNYSLPERTPAFEKDKKDFPKKYSLKFGSNPNKASVLLTNDSMVILIDNDFKKQGRLFVDFIIRHELGHFFYKTEKYADIAAYVAMINEGFNPSQIFYACALTLNRNLSMERIFNIYELNKKTKK